MLRCLLLIMQLSHLLPASVPNRRANLERTKPVFDYNAINILIHPNTISQKLEHDLALSEWIKKRIQSILICRLYESHSCGYVILRPKSTFSLVCINSRCLSVCIHNISVADIIMARIPCNINFKVHNLIIKVILHRSWR